MHGDVHRRKYYALIGGIATAAIVVALGFGALFKDRQPPREARRIHGRRNAPSAQGPVSGNAGATGQESTPAELIEAAAHAATESKWDRVFECGYHLIRLDPAEAVRAATLLPAGDKREDLLTCAAAEWTLRDPEAAMEWACRLDKSPSRDRTVASVAITWAERDPAGAVGLVMTTLEPSSMRDDALVSIAQRWAQQDPPGAIAWIAELPHNALRDAAIQAVTDQMP